MKIDQQALVLATGLGALTGIRSLSALTVMSMSLSGRPGEFHSGPAHLLSSSPMSTGLKLSAVGEAVADKLPFIPPRTQALPLLGRAALAAFGGAAVAQLRQTSPIPAGAIAAFAAICSATLATGLRRFATEQIAIPNLAAGLLEDIVVVKGSAMLFSALSR
jgi:uncharacterized membrane protein